MDEAEIARMADLDVERSFRAFALRFRQDIGRPMTKDEWTLAKLAHHVGFEAGAEGAARLLIEDLPR